jgi:hypothetical protein
MAMGYSSLAHDIAERQLEHGARGYISPFIFPTPTYASARPSDPDEATARKWNMTPEKLREFRVWVLKTMKEYEERLAREKVLVLKLNEQRTVMTLVGYMAKDEAVKKVAISVIGGELLNLDDTYGGMLVRVGYFFISEKKLLKGLERHGPDLKLDALIDHLIAERNERRAA